jgi:hypothetical protein
MCKRLSLLCLVVVLACIPAFGDVGIFDYTQDIGAVGGYGVTTTVAGSGQYEIIASGSDIQSTADEFHYAYNQVSGNVRFEMTPMWEVAPNSWSKIEAMLRMNNSAGSPTYGTVTRRGGVNTAVAPLSPVDSWVGLEFRADQGGGTSGGNSWDTAETPSKIAIQRVVSNGYQLVQSLVDYGGGAGWQNLDTRWVQSLPDALLLGVGVTSHNNQGLARAVISNVAYTQNPGLVGIPSAGAPLPEACGVMPGLKIRSLFLGEDVPWGYGAMNDLLDGLIEGYDEGTRIDQVVNLRDTGDGVFGDNKVFPGIDTYEFPAGDPANGEDDDYFATEVLACIELTAGLHRIGANSDDGTIIWIGDNEIARTGEFKGNSNEDFWFTVPADGFYSLKARSLEGAYGSSLELHWIFPDGSRILLGDVANGSPPVYVPEPATIALLGFGGLAMLRVRRKR